MSETNIEQEEGYRDDGCVMYSACRWKFMAAAFVFGAGLVLWWLETHGIFDIINFLWRRS